MVLAVVVVIALFFCVTTFTGFPAPGIARRYSASDLNDLVRKIDDVYALHDCGRPSDEPIASVDWLRSRVRLTAPSGAMFPLEFPSYSGNSRTEPLTDRNPGTGSGGLVLTPRDKAMIENPSTLVLPPATSCP
jgi:hypothetical protein